MRTVWIGCLVAWSLLSACRPVVREVTPRPGNAYAAGFELRDSADCCIAIVLSPWTPDKELARYVIREPMCRLAVSSCTHVGFLDAVGCTDRLTAVCNRELVYTPLSDGIIDLGDAMSPNYERLLVSAPDAVLVSLYAQEDPLPVRLRKLGVPVVYVNEWMEHTPLARAEWVRFVGALTGHRADADSLFAAVADRYNRLAVLAQSGRQRRSVMSGQSFRGTWYVPGGKTFMGRLFRDAGAAYRYADSDYEESIPLTMEQALRDFADNADVWVGVNARTMDGLRAADAKHTWFKPYRAGEVYHFMRRSTPQGANDFWERGVVHPDEILADLITVLYPDLLSEPLRYTGRCE